DHAVVAELADVEIVADAGPERRHDILDLLVVERPLYRKGFRIEDLPLEEQDRLRAAVAAAGGGSTGGLPLDEEQFGLFGVRRPAVDELARQARFLRGRRLAADFAGRIATRHPRTGGKDNPADHLVGDRRV